MNFLTPKTPGTDSKKLKHGNIFGLPDGSTTLTTHSKNLLLPGLPLAACKGEIGPLQQPLISIPQLCKNDLKVTFDKETATIYSQNGSPVLTGKFCPIKKLFLLPIGPSHSQKLPPQQLRQSANNAQISALDNKQNLAIWYHWICFSPLVTTWIKAIDAGFLSTWPGLTSKLTTKKFPPSVNTALGHLRQQYQNTRSTKKIEAPIQPPILHKKTNNAFVSFQPTNTIFSYQTGAFPIISRRGYRYIMFVYIYNINTILMRCLKTKAGVEHL